MSPRSAAVFEVAPPGPGRLGFMPRPRGGDWLDDEMRTLRRARVDVLVSLLTWSEQCELDLLGEGAAARRAGIDHRGFPVPDRTAPRRAALVAEADALVDRLAAGAFVVVHCRYGVGRSATLAAAVLVRLGGDPERVWAEWGACRGLPVPDTVEQRAAASAVPPLDASRR